MAPFPLKARRMERPIKLVIDGPPSPRQRGWEMQGTRACLVIEEFVLLPREQVYFTPKISQISAQSCSYQPLAPPSSNTNYSSLIFRTRVEFLSRYDQKASTLFLIFIFFFSFSRIVRGNATTFFVNQDVTNEERLRETNTDAERKDKRRALLPTVSAVVSRLVKCNVRAVISMLVPKKAFIVLTSRALWNRVIGFRYRLSFSFYYSIILLIVKKNWNVRYAFFTLKIKFQRNIERYYK